jgi:hypothetical protein
MAWERAGKRLSGTGERERVSMGRRSGHCVERERERRTRL